MKGGTWKTAFGISAIFNVLLLGALAFQVSTSGHRSEINWDEQKFERAEEIVFLKEFFMRVHQFDSNNYLANQASVLAWLSPQLAEQKKNEIERFLPRLQNSNISQTSRIVWIQQKSQDAFDVILKVRLQEKDQTSEFLIRNELELIKTAPTNENVWGFQIQNLKSEIVKEVPLNKKISLQKDRSLSLVFPCLVKSLSELSPSEFKVRLLTGTNSEVTLLALRTLDRDFSFDVRCEQKHFPFELFSGEGSLRWAEISDAQGDKYSPTQIQKNRAQIKRSLEKELGFELDESGPAK